MGGWEALCWGDRGLGVWGWGAQSWGGRGWGAQGFWAQESRGQGLGGQTGPRSGGNLTGGQEGGLGPWLGGMEKVLRT